MDKNKKQRVVSIVEIELFWLIVDVIFKYTYFKREGI